MDLPADPNLTGLLLLVNRLQQTGQPLGRQTLVAFAEMKLPRVAAAYEGLVDTLLKENLIIGDAEEFMLTPEGLNVVCDVSQRHSLNAWFYNEYYQAILHSQAHSLFCERVYGKDLGQHGMADMGQLQVMLSELQVKPGMALLDFGCGDGQISEHIAEITQTCVTGVDFAELAIKLAQDRTRNKRDRVQFEWVDLEKKPGSFPPVNFDCILAIDSVFFAQDQNAVTQQLLNHLKPGGIMGVFYICPPHVWAPETTFAKALDGLGVSYRVRDFSIQNTQHWKKKKQTLLELEPMFMEEGNAFLLKNRLAECDGLANFHRYLYIVTNS